MKFSKLSAPSKFLIFLVSMIFVAFLFETIGLMNKETNISIRTGKAIGNGIDLRNYEKKKSSSKSEIKISQKIKETMNERLDSQIQFLIEAAQDQNQYLKEKTEDQEIFDI